MSRNTVSAVRAWRLLAWPHSHARSAGFRPESCIPGRRNVGRGCRLGPVRSMNPAFSAAGGGRSQVNIGGVMRPWARPGRAAPASACRPPRAPPRPRSGARSGVSEREELIAQCWARGRQGTRTTPFEGDELRRFPYGCSTETVRDWIPRRFQAPRRYRGRLRRFPMTFDDADMLLAFQRRSVVWPSR